jgi:LuxR family maltose regulon positive regulatory protein
LTELRAAELRFTSSETIEFLNQLMGLSLSEDDVAALETRTEGWIAGLQLAAISMKGRDDAANFIKSFTGSHRFVMDYLIEEVLAQQPESIQSFLLQTAILNRLTGSLCDALTGQDYGQLTLEMLDHSNLFIIPLDDERCWYRYHHLFSDLLRQRLRQTQLDQIPILHIKASLWYEQNGFVDEAIEHALLGGDHRRAVILIDAHADAIWQRGEHTRFRRWLSEIPVELVSSQPQLCIINAWDLFMNGQREAAEQNLLAAEKVLEESIGLGTETKQLGHYQMDDHDRMKIQGRVATIRAYLVFYRGGIKETKKYVSEALENLPEHDLIWRSTATVVLGDAYGTSGELMSAYRVRLKTLEMSIAAGNAYWILIASTKLALTSRMLGKMEQVIEICQQQLELASVNGLLHTVVIGWLLAIWGEVLAELNDLDGAIQKAKRGVNLTERGREMGTLGWSYHCLLRVLFSSRNMVDAEELIQKMENIAREVHVPPWVSNRMAAWQARIWLVQDNLDAASNWVAERGLDSDDKLTFLHEREYIVLARILIAQGRLDEAHKLLGRLCEESEISGHLSRRIEVLSIQAQMFQVQGDTDQSITILENALALAGPAGYIRIFVDEGPPMASLLYEALDRGIAPEYVRGLLGAFPGTKPAQVDRPKSQAAEIGLVEPLSEREIEVLHLIAEGLTNTEVADRLYLSRNTIKVHTRNIYGKLGVNNRTQAVARARDLGILTSN